MELGMAKKKKKGLKKKDLELRLSKKEAKVLRKSSELRHVKLPLAQSLNITDPNVARKVNYIAGRLSSINQYTDLGSTFNLLKELETEIKPFLKDGTFDRLVQKDFGYVGVQDLYGYRPQGSTFSSLFPNPFHIFSYLAENHWAILDCRNVFQREILSDGYRLVGGSKTEQALAKDVCRALKMKKFRAQLADHAKVFGNFWVNPVRNGLRGIKDLEILLPQFLRPIPTRDGQHIKEWQYQKGPFMITYKKNELLHAQFRPCLKNYDLGNPPLGAVLVDIEADLQASMYNNIVFQKGGLIGLAVLLDGGATSGRGRGAGPTAYAQYLQEELSANRSGARGGFETVVFENTKSVEKLNDLASLDGAFHKTSDKCAKQIAHVLGIPHEKIGIITNSNQQYHPASTMDYSEKQLDKAIAELMDVVDTFINDFIFPLFGITTVRIKASPRYNSVTRAATQAGVDIGSLVGVISVNEYRMEWLGRPPLKKGGDVALMKYMLDGGTKPSATGGGAKPSKIIPPPPMPAIESEVEDEYNDEDEDEGLANAIRR